MSETDTARIMYQSARAEMMERIRLRDQVLLIYLGAVGTILGIGLGTKTRADILLVLPFLALGAAILVSQHNAVIGSIGDFCVRELGTFLKFKKEWAPQWDDSAALHAYSNSAIRLRSWGHTIIIVIPSIVALGLNWQHALKSPFPLGTLWWFGSVCCLLTTWIIVNTHNWRTRLYDKYEWSSRSKFSQKQFSQTTYSKHKVHESRTTSKR